jgi:hypothetical protein
MVAQGIYAFRPPLPAVIGNEGVGRVLAVAPAQAAAMIASGRVRIPVAATYPSLRSKKLSRMRNAAERSFWMSPDRRRRGAMGSYGLTIVRSPDVDALTQRPA